jgi:hypothetical protein
MSIDILHSFVPPPEFPIEIGTPQDWAKVQDSLGISLPKDISELMNSFGSGWFGKIQLFNPYSPAYINRITYICQIYARLRQDQGIEAIPHLIFPERPGLFPCGGNDEDGMLFWLTDGVPDQWPILLLDAGFRWQRFEMPITTFLAKIFSLELSCIWWNGDQSNEYTHDVHFRPIPL